jgi:aldehyde dehydrogenase (NAD+)
MQTAQETAQQTGQQETSTRARGAAREPEAPAPYKDVMTLLIGGVWRAGNAGKVAQDMDPYSGEKLAEIALADERDVDEAYRTAERAQRGWAGVGPQERRALLERAARLVELRKQEIVNWLIRESGSTYAKAVFEWNLVHLGMLEAAGYPFHVEGELLPASVRGKDSRVYRRAVGVVGVISPWNFPLHLANRSVAPALAVGDAVVLKAATDTPITGGLLLARIFEEAGLPPEVLSVVVGAASDIGHTFVAHPIPRVLSFTGSTAVGRHIGEEAGRTVKRVCLELSGNCPFLVLDDADLERAVDAALAGKFLHQGQSCLAINRIFVADRRHDEFRDRFVERVRALKVGNPAEVDTAIGPIINQQQLDAITRKLDETVARGARPVLRGDPQGLVMPPAVLDDVTNDMPAARDEVFGPVASILRFADEEEAIRLANDTEYGLSSAVFTRDAERGVRVAKRIDAGMTHVNDWPLNEEANTAFGGEKASGIGRFGGEWGVEEFTTTHWISVQEQPRAYPI